jgi:hypothetical protein
MGIGISKKSLEVDGRSMSFAVSRRFFARIGRFSSDYHALSSIKAVKAQFENNVNPEMMPYQSMKPTPKAFASRLAPLRNTFGVFATRPCDGLSTSR